MTFPSLKHACTLLILGLVTALAASAASTTRNTSSHKKTTSEPGAYKGAIVMEAASGKVLFEERADSITPPASMAKLMTFAVLHDLLASGRITLQTPITVNAADTRIGGTQVWLKEGEVFPVEELIYAMMIQSANDAAYTLARNSAGSVDAFVRLMNEKAKALGMLNTTFRTPHGLPPSDRNTSNGDLTSPRDFALLARHLLLNTDVLKYSSVRRRNFGAPVRVQPVVMDNHNHLLDRVSGVDGLKTGFTNGAGFCLTATALRNGHRVIVVIMGDTDKRSRDNKVIELLEQGFAAIPSDSPPFAASVPANSPAGPSPFAAAPMTAETARPATSATPGEEPMIKFNIPAPAKKPAR